MNSFFVIVYSGFLSLPVMYILIETTKKKYNSHVQFLIPFSQFITKS